MPCYRPNMALFKTDTYPKKEQIRFISSFHIDSYEFFDEENAFFRLKDEPKEWIRIPCTQCIGCQEAYTKEWAVRCMLEASLYEYNYFVTLTYNDEHLPLDEEVVNKNTGEIGESASTGCLKKDDLKNFIKRLRRYFKYHFDFPETLPDWYEDDVSEQFLIPPKGIRFYACGEYGGLGERPHYHLILFNCPIPLDDLKVHSCTRDGNIIWNSSIIEKCWSDKLGQSIGFSSVCEVNWDTCAYTARYCLKKVKGKLSQDYYFDKGQLPEYTVMSRMPGIGKQFFDSHFQEIYANDEMIIKGHAEKIKPCKPVKYFDNLFRDMYPDDFDAIADRRKRISISNNKLKLYNTTLSEKEQLQVECRSKESKMKMFKLQRNKF